MNLKNRLITANTSIVIVPLLITLLIALITLYFYTILNKTNVDFANAEKAAEISYDLFAISESIWSEKPENLARPEFAQYISAHLEDINAEVLILADKTPVYQSLNVNSIDIEKLLELENGVLPEKIGISQISYLSNIHRFEMNDGRDGYIILLAPVNKGILSAGYFVVFIVIIYFLSFLTMNIINSAKLSRSIAKPLGRLAVAIVEISNGDLDHEVIEEGDEEIREVLRALEKLRLKLKSSIGEQLKYDENRKMLISSISHDLKTPITSIKGYVEGVLDGVTKTPEQQEKYLRTVVSKADQVDKMIDDLVLYSKLDLNQIPFSFEPADPERYFRECVDENEPEMASAGIKLTFSSTLADINVVMMDREKMKRAVQNILDNARKYSGESDSIIQILLRETTDRVIIEIADNGTGIPREVLPLIFERFYRTDTARNTAGGSGLGLAITREIVEAHGGQIWVTSKEGEGTQFMISLQKVSPDKQIN